MMTILFVKRLLPRSPPGICRENVVICFYSRVACVTACGVVPEGSKRVGRCIILKLSVSPSARVPESLGILLDERNRFQSVWHHHEIGGLRALFCGPLDLHDLGAIGKMLAIAGDAVP